MLLHIEKLTKNVVVAVAVITTGTVFVAVFVVVVCSKLPVAE